MQRAAARAAGFVRTAGNGCFSASLAPGMFLECPRRYSAQDGTLVATVAFDTAENELNQFKSLN